VKIVQRDNADTEELRARNPWRSISAGPSGGWPLLPGGGDRAAGLALTIQIVWHSARRQSVRTDQRFST